MVDYETVVPGGIYRAHITGVRSDMYESDVLVLDYSPGNRMVVMMVASVGEVGNSKVLDYSPGNRMAVVMVASVGEVGNSKVLDYSPGNRMVVVMVASVGDVGNSVLKVPFQLDGDDRMRVVHAHQMRTISEGRLKQRLGAVSLDVINQVKTALGLIVS